MPKAKHRVEAVEVGDDGEATVRRRLGGMGDAELAEALASKVFAILKPIQSRPKFRDARKSLFVLLAMFNALASETEDEPAAQG